MREISFAQAVNEAIREEMERDPTVFLQGEDVGPYGGGYFPVLAGLWEKFGSKRVRDFPISETAMVGSGLGAAMTGLRPIVDLMFSDFAFVAMDQIVNQVAKMRYMSGGKASVPMVIRAVIGGYQSLAAQHSHSPEAIFTQFPGLVVVVPSDPANAKGLLKSAIRNDNPVLFFEHKMLYQCTGPVPDGDHLLPLGKAAIAREGRDVTVAAYAYMTSLALQAADELSGEGVEVEVVDLLTLAPLDREGLLGSVRRTGCLVAVQEAPPMCGLASEVIAMAATDSSLPLRAPLKRVTGREAPVPFSPVLENYILPQREDIVRAVKEVMVQKRVQL